MQPTTNAGLYRIRDRQTVNARREFFLLAPESLPDCRQECIPTHESAAALEIINSCSPDVSDELALAQARKALVHLGLNSELLIPMEGDPNESPDNRSNDRAFGIVRVRGETMSILTYSTLQGFVTLLEEASAGGANVSADDWNKLRRAFFLLFHLLDNGRIDGFMDSPHNSGEVQSPRAANEQHSALSRWTRGHHAFMTLIQGLVVVFRSFQHEVEDGHLTQAKESLRAATCLMAASGVALRFTGDFRYSDYEREVRPTLMPPIAPEGLTGLYWRDHEYLIKSLTKMRSLFTGIDTSLREELHSFHEALKNAYESHKCVCASFVGNQQPSLLMASRTDKSAVDTLDHFMRVRLNLIKD
jgi:hypothetical protein